MTESVQLCKEFRSKNRETWPWDLLQRGPIQARVLRASDGVGRESRVVGDGQGVNTLSSFLPLSFHSDYLPLEIPPTFFWWGGEAEEEKES